MDDMSTDGTRDLLRGLAERDPRVRGVLLSRNFGLASAHMAALRIYNEIKRRPRSLVEERINFGDAEPDRGAELVGAAERPESPAAPGRG